MMPKMHEDYSVKVGARKATASVAANTVVSAAPATLIVTMMRYNGVDLWPMEADPAATAAIMAALTGVPRFIGDWIRMNVTEPRYKARRAEQDSLGTPAKGE